ncbi:exported hypothetical protein [uncultured Gammaproteobacteria bacterium]
MANKTGNNRSGFNAFGFAMAAAGAATAAAAGATTGAQAGEASGVTITTSGKGGSVSINGLSMSSGSGGSTQSTPADDVLIRNDKVWIGGMEVPPNVSTFAGPSGRLYTIHRDDGHVGVTSN